jgi:hypothetical protein
MWIKIFLTLSIIGSGLAIFFAEKQIKPKILGLNENIAQLDSTLKTEKGEHKKTSDELESTKLARDTLQAQKQGLERDLADEKKLRSQAEATTKQALSKERSARDEADRVKQMNQEFWELNKQLGLTPPQIRTEHKELPSVKGELATIKDENKILMSQFTKLEGEYAILRNPDKKVVQPIGIRGKVVAVDPKWRFVILNIGSNHGVRKAGELTVSRSGRYVARLKVSSVETAHSIANVMDDYDADEDGVQEGDEVVAPNQP